MFALFINRLSKIADWQLKARKPLNFLTREHSKSYYEIIKLNFPIFSYP